MKGVIVPLAFFHFWAWQLCFVCGGVCVEGCVGVRL